MYRVGGGALWASNTAGHAGAVLYPQTDGNLVLYGPAALWSSHTMQSPPGSVGARETNAIAWANSQIGSNAYVGLCQKFVENAYGTSGRYASAIAMYNAMKSAGVINTSSTNIPKGAIVFASYPAYDEGYGHAELSRGDGTFVSGGVSPAYGASVQAFSSLPAGYLGWCMAPSSWPGR